MADDQQKDTDAPEVVENEAVQEEASKDAVETVPEEATQEVAEETPEETPVEAAEEPAAETPAEEPVAEAAEEAPAAEATAEAPAEEPATEAEAEEPAVEAATEAPTEAAEEAEAPAEEVAVANEEAAAPRIFGYKGEIEGEVIKLEDLDTVKDDDDVDYDELMKMIDETLTNVSENEIVSGKIVSIGEKDVVIDIGFKSDGIVSKNEFGHVLEPGEMVEVFLERIEDYHGQLVLSKTKADTVKRWQKIEAAHNDEQVLEGTIVRRIKGGMIVELFDGVEAFLPGSQIDVRPVRDFDAYLDKKMEFKIVKLNPVNENIVVSHKALIEKDLEEQRQKILSSMEPGQVLEGAVKNITDFGVFIDLGGVDGLLHITDLSWGRVSHPSELVELDEKLNVVVLDYDKDRQRISLGLKQLQSHPWENIGEKYKEADEAEGKVVSITDYGAFVELEKGIEGLVHISEMSWTEHIKHPSQMVSLGQVVKIKILNIDHDGKKISLGMKQLEPDPWDGIAARYPAGTVLRGTVRNITNFGVFVEIEPGIDGLVHISDLSWTKKIRHPAEYVKKGQELDVVILNIDENERRISLGHKQIETNPWNDFGKIYAEGTDVEVTVKKLVDNGIEVDLGLELEGLLPVSEMNNKNFRDNYKEGDKLSLRVIKFDPTNKEIVLSETAQARAAEKEQRDAENREKRAEQQRERKEVKEFTEKAKKATGPTTLGELSGLEDLKRQMEAAEAVEVKTDTPPAEEKAADPPATEKVMATEPEEVNADVKEEAPAEEAKAEEAAKEEEAPAEAKEEAPAEAKEEAPAEEAKAEEAPAEKAKAEEKPKKAKAAPKKKAAAKKTKAKDEETEEAPKAKKKAKAKSEDEGATEEAEAAAE